METSFKEGDIVKLSPTVKRSDLYRGRTGTVVEVRDSNGPKAQMLGVRVKGVPTVLWYWGYELKGVASGDE